MLTTRPNRVSAMFADPIQAVFREIEREFPWSENGALAVVLGSKLGSAPSQAMQDVHSRVEAEMVEHGA